MSRKEAGLTLIEILLALALLALLFSLVYPSYGRAVAKTRVAETHALLQDSITTSMRHAVVTGRTVVMCPTLDGESCSSGPDWTSGWILFVDRDSDRLRSPTEPLAQQQVALPKHVRVTGSAGRPRLVFRPSGSNPGSNATFTLCHQRFETLAVSLILANNGRLRRTPATGSAEDGCRTG